MKRRDDNAINRVLGAHGLGTLDDSGVVSALGDMVADHQHLAELLRACEPDLRREMYEAMTPHLKFTPKPLEDYVIAAKEHAEAAQLPTMDSAGNLHPYRQPFAGSPLAKPAPHEELHVTCRRCGKGVFFTGERKADAIRNLRDCGWAYDELGIWHLCPECLNHAMDKTSS